LWSHCSCLWSTAHDFYQRNLLPVCLFFLFLPHHFELSPLKSIRGSVPSSKHASSPPSVERILYLYPPPLQYQQPATNYFPWTFWYSPTLEFSPWIFFVSVSPPVCSEVFDYFLAVNKGEIPEVVGLFLITLISPPKQGPSKTVFPSSFLGEWFPTAERPPHFFFEAGFCRFVLFLLYRSPFTNYTSCTLFMTGYLTRDGHSIGLPFRGPPILSTLHAIISPLLNGL